jgi:hypothetical protein
MLETNKTQHLYTLKVLFSEIKKTNIIKIFFLNIKMK